MKYKDADGILRDFTTGKPVSEVENQKEKELQSQLEQKNVMVGMLGVSITQLKIETATLKQRINDMEGGE